MNHHFSAHPGRPTKPGFSLIELMVSMVISVIIISGTVGVLQAAFRIHITNNTLITLDTQVQLARDRIQHQLRTAEPEFWQHFPIHTHPLHPVDVARGPFTFSQRCPQSNHPCFTTYDLKPLPRPYVFSFTPPSQPLDPQPWFHLEPQDRHHAEDQPLTGYVGWFTNGNESFTALIDQGNTRDIRLAPPSLQPWPIPNTMQPGAWEAVILGSLHVVHWSLRTETEHGKSLTEQHWTFQNTRWWPRRTKITQRFLHDLWCYQNNNDYFLLIGAADPDRLPSTQPITIGGKTFTHPIRTATIRW